MSFDRKAEQYDAMRPSYPDALVDDVLARTGAHRILEVGAGTGKATTVFARRPCTIVALEPAPQMASVLRRNVAAFPDVTVEEQMFESFEPDGSFELVLAAQAFHWIEPEVRYRHAAAALRTGGSLALLTNERAELDPALRAELDDAYLRWVPDADNARAHDTVEQARGRWTGELDASGAFGPVHVAMVPWRARYTSRQYVALIDTYSDHAVLADEHRIPLYGDIFAAIERRGGELEIPYVAMAFVARRR